MRLQPRDVVRECLILMSRHWYQFKSKDRKVKGIILTRSKAAVARFAGYPISELVIERVVWNGQEFVKCKK